MHDLIAYGAKQKASLMPLLTPARCSVQIGRTGASVGKLPSVRQLPKRGGGETLNP